MTAQSEPGKIAQPAKGRIEAIDLARAAALVAMAIYHFTWDLEFFGYIEPGTAGHGGWKFFARCIASSFLFLVGVSLYLAHRKGIRWRPFWLRLAMVAGAALAITLVTYIAVPNGFIFFGILHEIALASVLGLLFLRLPPLLTLLVAAAIIAIPNLFQSALFDHPALLWVGLSETRPVSNDYVPVFPWFGPVLAGLAAARLGASAGLFERLRQIRFGKWSLPFQFAGRHSLAFYLIHQPVLISCVWLFSQVHPAAQESPEVRFRQSCEQQCLLARDQEFCAHYCVCVLDRFQSDQRLTAGVLAEPNEEQRQAMSEIAARCTAATDEAMSKGGAN